MKQQIKLITAIDPADLILQANDALSAGNDLYTPLFVSFSGLLCQRVIPSLCMYEYQLVIASDLEGLETKERELTEMGFDYVFQTVIWREKYLQWMSRMNSAGRLMKETLAKLAEQPFTPAERTDELSLVEDVRKVLHMEPVSQDVALVTIPFSLKFS